jgi:TolB protein
VAVGGAGATTSGDAGELAFVRGGNVYTVRADGTGLRRLTRTRLVEGGPAWSPDGTRLAYNAGGSVSAQILVRDAASGRTRAITRGRAQNLSPAWSPDGKRLAFASNRAGTYDIYLTGADGRGVRRLTRLGSSFSPAWSPDGRTIVFSSSGRTPENPELYSIRPDGSGLRRLTRTAGGVDQLGDDGMPSWSPDGRRIAFTSNRTGDGEVWTMAPTGRDQRRLLGFPRRDDWWPRYSPDGSTLAFARLTTGRSDLYLADATGRNVRLLLQNGAEPSWRASG